MYVFFGEVAAGVVVVMGVGSAPFVVPVLDFAEAWA